MSNKYYNFNLNGYTGIGTSANPFTVDQFIYNGLSGDSLSANDILICSGVGSTNNINAYGSSVSAISVVPWGNMPWAFHSNGGIFTIGLCQLTMSGGILDVGYINSFNSITLNNMWVHTFQNILPDYNNNNITLNNSTLIVSGYSSDDEFPSRVGNVSINNSVVLYQNPVSGCFFVSTSSTNSIINSKTSCLYLDSDVGSPNELFHKGSSSAVNDISINTTFGVTIPSLPSYNDPNIFDFNLFPGYGVGVIGGWAFNNTGHIGAFYLGAFTNNTVTLQNSHLLLNTYSPHIFIHNYVSSVSVTKTIPLFLTPRIPIVYSFSDIDIDFIGVPRQGASPLLVNFTALVNFGGQYINKFKINNYTWYFDYDNNPTNPNFIKSSGNNPNTFFIYKGYQGQQFSVKLCVVLELL